jgi:hypothetical protein
MKILLVAAFCCNRAIGQLTVISKDSIPAIRILSINPRQFQWHDTTWIYSGICKTLSRTYLPVSKKTIGQAGSSKPAFLKVHGNIQYDFLYRSFTDTPFYQQDFRQHTVKTNYNFLFRNLFPVQVTVLHRNSNSPYFRDITDVSVKYSQQDYMKHLKENLVQQATAIIKTNNAIRLTELEKKYKQKLDEVEGLQLWISSPARLQEMVEERERNIRHLAAFKADSLQQLARQQLPGLGLPGGLPEMPNTDAVKKAISDKLRKKLKAGADSLLARIEKIELEKKARLGDSLQKLKSKAHIEGKKKEREKLRKELEGYKKQLSGAKKNLADSLLKVKQEIARLKDAGELKNYIRQKKLNAKELPKGWEPLTAIRSVGIGRSWVDYSELTVKNISLTGVNIEANPGKLYIAAAAGRINYRFRDFAVRQQAAQPRQSLYLLRGGIGKKDGNNFILTWYDGKRSLLNPFMDTLSTNTKLERVIGMSAETRVKLNDNQYIVAEFAKSSFHTTGTVSQQAGSLFEKMRNFKDHSNEAYSIKLYSHWPDAGTKLTGYYKKMGEHFQSFNLQPVNTVQEAFQVKLQQQLWKKKLVVDAAIRKNDFSNPFLTPGINSSNVFKSLQLSLRIPKYPFLTVGYAPSTQLTVLDNQRLAENQYNTLNAVLTHSYRAKKMNMVTNAMFLKFYNSSPDTGFIYYNASSFALTQFMYIGPWQLQSGLTVTNQQELKVLTLEQEATLRVKSWLSLTAGMKYNRVSNKQTLWGGSAGMNMSINKIGLITLNYDKAYLPGTRRDLLPVHTGNIGYYRSF